MTVRVKLNLKGINALMTSREVTGAVIREAQRMQAEAGENFEYDVSPHRYTARAYIRAANAAGAKEQQENAVLERVVGS